MAGSPNFLAQLGGNVKRALVRRAIWALVALVLGGVGVGWNHVKGMFSPAEEPVAASVQPAAPAVPAPAAPAPNADDAPVAGAVPAKAAPAKPDAPAAAGPRTVARAASSGGAGAPVVTAVPQPANAPGSTLAHIDDHLTYQYNALGRRDPFQSLVDGAFVGADVGGDAPPDPGGIKVVGIVWGSSDQFALVEDVRGNSFVLRKGDKVQNGFVEGLKRDALIVTITSENQSQTVEIPLVRKGDQNAR